MYVHCVLIAQIVHPLIVTDDLKEVTVVNQKDIWFIIF